MMMDLNREFSDNNAKLKYKPIKNVGICAFKTSICAKGIKVFKEIKCIGTKK